MRYLFHKMSPALPLLHRLETLSGKPIARVQPIQRGYTPALRWLVDFTDGTTAFAKIGVTENTAIWLIKEYEIYTDLHAPFMPKLLGWDDDPAAPILLLEDLRHAHWPPPWTATQIQQVLDTLSEIWSSTLPDLPRVEDLPGILNGWQTIAKDPHPFLSLGLVTEKWLDTALPTFLSIHGAEVAHGDALLHQDIRSDNICLLNDRALLVDWNFVCLGNPRFDLGFWLPSLEAEGGPPPETILPDAGDIAGIITGFYASRAGLPIIPDAPRVRHIQQVQLKHALPWAVRALGLPPLDGPSGS